MQPESDHPAKAGFFSSAESRVDALEVRLVAAIERWYAAHFHRAALAGVSAISADDKSALVEHVTAAVSPQPEESSNGTV
jgi:hypothetical protein